MTGPVTPAPVAAAPITPPPAMPGFATSAPLTAVPATPGPVMPVPDGVPVGAGISDVSDAHGGPDDCQNAMSCGDGCCSPAGRFWFQGDYLLWWTKGTNLPPLVTTSGTDQSGVLGPGTTVLFGDTTAEDRARSGADLTLGMWLNCCQTWGIEGNYFTLGRLSAGFENCLSNGYPLLARPFFNTETAAQDAELVAYPGLLAGRVIVNASDDFQSAGLHFRHNLCCWDCCCGSPDCGDGGCGCGLGGDCCCRKSFKLDMIAGYRYYDLSDNVSVQEQLVSLVSAVPTGTQINVADSFRARNAFNGGELGLIADYSYGRWSWELSAKMSLGWNHDVVNINGSTTNIAPDGTVTGYSGGLLALDTNIGEYTRNSFVVVPEFGIQIAYQFTERLRFLVGYDFLYWTQVARAADQINLNVDPRNLPPVQAGAGPEPTFSFNTTSFWAQGIRLGAEYRF